MAQRMISATGKTLCSSLKFGAAWLPGVALYHGMAQLGTTARSGFFVGTWSSAGSPRTLEGGTAVGSSQRVRKRLPVRHGLTLLELLLVLVVVAAVVALAWPALDRPFANQRLRRAADQVRAAIARARNRAMVEGVPYEFRFVPGGSEFQIAAYDPLAEEDRPIFTTAALPSEGTSTALRGRRAGVLPPDVYFTAPSVAAAKSGAAGTDTLAAQADGWSLPIVLFPDGTGTSATITLANNAGRMIDVHLRGLSGSARVSEPYAAANVP